MDNLQTASTVVDASARIYSFRVDAVHYDVLKMAGGLSKAAQVIGEICNYLQRKFLIVITIMEN